MGDMADFINMGCWDCVDYNPIEDMLTESNETIIFKFDKLKIPSDYEFKYLCEKIREYYNKYKKLSERQKVALCCAIYNLGE